MELYPIIMDPAFKHGPETPWGGHTLKDALLKCAPADETGMSCEVSTEAGYESIVGNGKYTAITLAQLGHKLQPDVFGDGSDGLPISVSLLDVAGEYTSVMKNSTVWVIINREPDGAFSVDGCACKPLPGDVYYLPTGAECALAHGILAYCAAGLNDAAPTGRGKKNEGTTVLVRGGSVTYYVCDESLEFCRLNLDGTMPLPSGRMLALTATAPCRILWGEDGSIDLDPFATAVIPAALQGVRLAGRSKLLMASSSRQDALRSILGYRAENVCGL